MFMAVFIFHTCQNLKETKKSFKRWMDKQIVIYLDNGVLISDKKKWAIKSQKKKWRKKMHIAFVCLQHYNILEKAIL